MMMIIWDQDEFNKIAILTMWAKDLLKRRHKNV
jgi:hypothetical protein